MISEEVHNNVNQRSLKVELLACLYHRGKKFLDDYEYTSKPPTIIGSGFSGDVVLCKRREKAAVVQNQETSVRCVKSFNLQLMGPDKLEMLGLRKQQILKNHPYEIEDSPSNEFLDA